MELYGCVNLPTMGLLMRFYLFNFYSEIHYSSLMDSQPPKNATSAPRKMKFVPKATKLRPRKPSIPKSEEIEDAEAKQTKDLLRRFAENSATRRQKIERKVASTQVAFGYGGESTVTKSHRVSKGGSSSTSGLRGDKEYKEPWDYYSNYPVTLPMRRPYAGNPELLDEEEFAGTIESITYDENSRKPAIDLGLMEESLEQNLIFLQLPTTLPIIKRSPSKGGEEIPGNSKQASGGGSFGKTCSLDDLPGGLMGKMLVYKSGAIKLKLGETLYDVSTGLDCVFAQDVVAINTEEKHCCIVGELTKRAIVTPDVDSIVDSLADLG